MTELVAKIAGPYLFVTGIGFIISTRFYERMVSDNAGAHPVTLNLSGAAHFIIGMIILVQHFRFSSASEIAVTLLGIAAVLKGGALIAIPELVLESPRSSSLALRISGFVFVFAGIYLSYVGFGI